MTIKSEEGPHVKRGGRSTRRENYPTITPWLSLCAPSSSSTSRPNWYLKETRKKKMSNDRLKPFLVVISFLSSFYQNSPTKTPLLSSAISCLFSFCSNSFFFFFFFLLLHYKLIISWEDEGKKKERSRGASCITSGVVFIFMFLNTSFFFWSFFYMYYIINISWVFNRYPFAFLLLFYILEKDFVNYCFLSFEMRQPPAGKIKTNPPIPPPTPPPPIPLFFPFL